MFTVHPNSLIPGGPGATMEVTVDPNGTGHDVTARAAAATDAVFADTRADHGDTLMVAPGVADR